MARIPTADLAHARGPRRLVAWIARRQYGGIVPGVAEVTWHDVRVGLHVSWLYDHLNLRKSSPLTRLQREMVATVVNGLIGGAP